MPAKTSLERAREELEIIRAAILKTTAQNHINMVLGHQPLQIDEMVSMWNQALARVKRLEAECGFIDGALS